MTFGKHPMQHKHFMFQELLFNLKHLKYKRRKTSQQTKNTVQATPQSICDEFLVALQGYERDTHCSARNLNRERNIEGAIFQKNPMRVKWGQRKNGGNFSNSLLQMSLLTPIRFTHAYFTERNRKDSHLQDAMYPNNIRGDRCENPAK